MLVYKCGPCDRCDFVGELTNMDICNACSEVMLQEMQDDLKYQRLCSEYCASCMTRHHPEQPCQDKWEPAEDTAPDAGEYWEGYPS